jgi:hypothetical protein
MIRLVRLHLLMAITVLIVAVACTRYHIPVASGPTEEPRASWRIRAGTPLNEHEVCSSNADQPCVIRASSQDEPTSVVVTVYLHPMADAKTTYEGALFADFLGMTRATGYEREVNVTIEPGRRPTGLTAAGLLTSSPGRYFFRMALLAQVPMHTDPYPFQQSIVVEVIPS